MKQAEINDKCWREFDCPEIKLPGHQAELKSRLLAAKCFQANNNFNYSFMIKHLKYIVPVLAVFIVAIVFGFGKVPGVGKTEIANAQEMIKESEFAISQISAEARMKLEELIQGDLSESLTEAYNAKDLIYAGEVDMTKKGEGIGIASVETNDISIDVNEKPSYRITFGKTDEATGQQVKKETASVTVFSTSTAGSNLDISSTDTIGNGTADTKIKVGFGKFTGDSMIEMTQVKIFKYTDKNGNEVTLGLNADNLPVMKVVILKD